MKEFKTSYSFFYKGAALCGVALFSLLSCGNRAGEITTKPIDNHIEVWLTKGDESVKLEQQKSLPFKELSKDASLEETKNGFKFDNNIGTTVFTSFFRYNKKENNIVLVALKRKIVSNDYSTENGESSFDTVSKEFVGKWNRLDQSTNKVIALPTLKAKIDLENVSLNNFNDNYLKKFEQQSLTFYKAEIAK